MGGMDLIFIPVLVRRLLGPLGLSGPMTSTFWTHRFSKRSLLLEGITCLQLPTCPHHPRHPLPSTHSLIRAIRDITVVVKKLLKIQQCQLSTYYRQKYQLNNYSSYTLNLAQLQASTTEPCMMASNSYLVSQNQVTLCICFSVCFVRKFKLILTVVGHNNTHFTAAFQQLCNYIINFHYGITFTHQFIQTVSKSYEQRKMLSKKSSNVPWTIIIDKQKSQNFYLSYINCPGWKIETIGTEKASYTNLTYIIGASHGSQLSSQKIQ